MLFAVSLRIMKIPGTPERRITPLFGSVRFCSRKGHSLAIFAHTPSPIVLAKSAEDYSCEIAEWQVARRSIGAGYAEVWPFCHSGFFDIQSISRTSPAGGLLESYSRATRRGASRRTSRSCRICCLVGARRHHTAIEPNQSSLRTVSVSLNSEGLGSNGHDLRGQRRS